MISKCLRVLFQDLEMPKPDIDLAVGSGSHAVQTADYAAFDGSLKKKDLICCCRRRRQLHPGVRSRGFPTVYSGGARRAGLRSFRRTTPEEVNRVLTSQLSDLLFVTSSDAMQPNQ